MKNRFNLLSVLLLLLLIGCENNVDATATATQVATTASEPATTDALPAMAISTTAVEPTVMIDATATATATVEPTPTIVPTPSQEEVLDTFSERLQALLIAQDWQTIEAISAENVQFGILPYGIFGYAADQAIGALRNSYLPEQASIRFADSVPDDINPADHFYDTAPIARVLYASGLGPDRVGDGLIYIVELPNGAFGFGGMVLSYDKFSPAAERMLLSPPPGVLYRHEGRLWRVNGDGSAESLFFTEGDQRLSVNLQGTHALRFASQFQATTITTHDLISGVSQTYSVTLDAANRPVATWHDQWLSETVAVIGVWDAAAHAYPAHSGAAALFDVADGSITLLDGKTMMANAPSVNNGRIVWATVEGRQNKIKLWEDGMVSEISAEPFIDLGITAGDNSLFSPALSADGRVAWWAKGIDDDITLVLADGDSVETLINIPALAIGGFPPPAVWSPDGRQLAFKAWTASPSLDGIHVYDTEREAFTYLGIGSDKPFWYDDWQLIYSQTAGAESDTLMRSRSTIELALPEGAVLERVLPNDCTDSVIHEQRYQPPAEIDLNQYEMWPQFKLYQYGITLHYPTELCLSFNTDPVGIGTSFSFREPILRTNPNRNAAIVLRIFDKPTDQVLVDWLNAHHLKSGEAAVADVDLPVFSEMNDVTLIQIQERDAARFTFSHMQFLFNAVAIDLGEKVLELHYLNLDSPIFEDVFSMMLETVELTQMREVSAEIPLSPNSSSAHMPRCRPDAQADSDSPVGLGSPLFCVYWTEEFKGAHSFLIELDYFNDGQEPFLYRVSADSEGFNFPLDDTPLLGQSEALCRARKEYEVNVYADLGDKLHMMGGVAVTAEVNCNEPLLLAGGSYNPASWEAVNFDSVGITMQKPSGWAHFEPVDYVAIATNFYTERGGTYHIAISEFPNPDGLPLADLYGQNWPELRDNFAASLTETSINGVRVLKGGQQPSLNPQLNYWFDLGDRYLRIGLEPYDADDLNYYEQQEWLGAVFEAMIQTVTVP